MPAQPAKNKMQDNAAILHNGEKNSFIEDISSGMEWTHYVGSMAWIQLATNSSVNPAICYERSLARYKIGFLC